VALDLACRQAQVWSRIPVKPSPIADNEDCSAFASNHLVNVRQGLFEDVVADAITTTGGSLSMSVIGHRAARRHRLIEAGLRRPFLRINRAILIRNRERRKHGPVTDFELLKDVMKMLFDSAMGNLQACLSGRTGNRVSPSTTRRNDCTRVSGITSFEMML
jgi:hypothetical protein